MCGYNQNLYNLYNITIEFVKVLTNSILFAMIRLEYKRWSKTRKNVK